MPAEGRGLNGHEGAQDGHDRWRGAAGAQTESAKQVIAEASLVAMDPGERGRARRRRRVRLCTVLGGSHYPCADPVTVEPESGRSRQFLDRWDVDGREGVVGRLPGPRGVPLA